MQCYFPSEIATFLVISGNSNQFHLLFLQISFRLAENDGIRIRKTADFRVKGSQDGDGRRLPHNWLSFASVSTDIQTGISHHNLPNLQEHRVE